MITLVKGSAAMVARKSAAKKTTAADAADADAGAAPTPAKQAVRKAAKKKAPAPAPKPAPKKTAKKSAAKKPPTKKPAGKKPATKKTAVKTAATKAPAGTAPAKKKSAPAKAKKAPAKKPAAKKAAATKATPAPKTGAHSVAAKKTPAAKTAVLTPREPGDLAVRPGEDPWTSDEVAEARTGLASEAERLEAQIAASEEALSGLMRDSSDTAGDDEADTGTKNVTREHELSLAANAREMLYQTRRALERIETGTYGLCESCGNPIGKARMQAFPRATLCVECKQKQERR